METGTHSVLPLCLFVILLRQQLTRTAGLALDERNEYLSAVVGDNVTLPCRNGPEANESTVTWWYQRTRTSADHEDVFVAGQLVNGFRTKCSIDTSNKNEFNLIIFGVTLNEAGLYTCIEDGGFGTRHLIHLRVSETKIMATTSSGSRVDSQLVKDEHSTGMTDLLPGFTDTLQGTGGRNSNILVAITAALTTIAILVVAVVVIAIVKRRFRSSQRDEHALIPRHNPESKRQFWREIIRKVKESIKEKVNTIRVAIANEKVRDTSALTNQPSHLDESVHLLATHIREREKPDAIVGLDSRGFALGPLVARELELPFVAVRNGGRVVKGITLYEKHETRTGQKIVKLQKDALPPVPDGGEKLRVVVVDDELATGGSLVATVKLLRQIGDVEVTECVILAELLDYKGREKMSSNGYIMPEVFSLIEVEEQRPDTDDGSLWKFQINDGP